MTATKETAMEYGTMTDLELAAAIDAAVDADSDESLFALNEVAARAGVNLDDSEIGLTEAGSATITRWLENARKRWFEITDLGNDAVLMRVLAADAVGALNAYSEIEGFAHYAPVGSTEPDAIVPDVHEDGTATAPFTNYEIRARAV